MIFEQRANIKFCFKLGKTAAETNQMMQKVYGNECLSHPFIYEWFKRFNPLSPRGRLKKNDRKTPNSAIALVFINYEEDQHKI